jgi:hypothetical protein
MCSWHPPQMNPYSLPLVCSQLTSFPFCKASSCGMKSKELTPKQVLAFPCLTCGAKRRERCELSIEMPVQTRIGIDV